MFIRRYGNNARNFVPERDNRSPCGYAVPWISYGHGTYAPGFVKRSRYLTTFTMLKNGSMMAMTMVPTIPQTTKMTAGSSMLERFLTSESISRL